MKILLIHRYFWPDTPPYAAMLRSIGKRLVEDGHDVSVLSSQPSYKASASAGEQPSREQLDGMTVDRVRLFIEANRNVLFRLFNMIYFPLRIFLFILFKGKFDTVMVSTAPPVVVGLAASLAVRLRGGDFIYHCMDVHPEIGALSGEFKHPMIFWLLSKLDTFSCNVARKVIVLSTDMKDSIERRSGYRNNNISVINNFSMPEYGGLEPVDDSLFKGPGKFRVLFAGNLGRFQGLEVFVDAMKILSHRPEIELVFLGEGSALCSLKERAKGMGNVMFLPHQSVGVARKVMRDSDLGIVSLNKEIYKYAYPSKTMTYISEGCPLLVSVERGSELASFVTKTNVGVCVDVGSAQSIASTIEAVFNDKNNQASMKASAVKVSEELYSEKVVLDRWSSLVNELSREN